MWTTGLRLWWTDPKPNQFPEARPWCWQNLTSDLDLKTLQVSRMWKFAPPGNSHIAMENYGKSVFLWTKSAFLNIFECFWEVNQLIYTMTWLKVDENGTFFEWFTYSRWWWSRSWCKRLPFRVRLSIGPWWWISEFNHCFDENRNLDDSGMWSIHLNNHRSNEFDNVTI